MIKQPWKDIQKTYLDWDQDIGRGMAVLSKSQMVFKANSEAERVRNTPLCESANYRGWIGTFHKGLKSHGDNAVCIFRHGRL